MRLNGRFHARTFFTLFTCFSAVFFGFLVPVHAAVIDRAKEAGLVPHRAIYDIQLASKKSGSQVVNISGKMFYEWQPSCDAWISNHRFDLNYEYADAPPVHVVSDFSTYESFDGKVYNFTSQRKTNGDVFEELRGSANIDSNPKLSKAVYTLPDGLSFDLPEGSLFPMAHTLEVLKALKEGKKFFSATTFDGSDKEGPVEINTFLGKAASIPEKVAASKEIHQDMLKSKPWKARLAFFPLNNSESAADYEMNIIFHENGIISDMDIDYGNFSVTQKLTALEPLGDACGTKAAKSVPEMKEHVK